MDYGPSRTKTFRNQNHTFQSKFAYCGVYVAVFCLDKFCFLANFGFILSHVVLLKLFLKTSLLTIGTQWEEKQKQKIDTTKGTIVTIDSRVTLETLDSRVYSMK